jgi:bifunctional DNA-binding transcriptional regulator/antitoxin component of YhaV-PrlF toxin-antitoxin module
VEIKRITSEDQTGITEAVRHALGLEPGDVLAWDVYNGSARVWKISDEEWAFLKGAEQNLAEEWLSALDMEAFRDL